MPEQYQLQPTPDLVPPSPPKGGKFGKILLIGIPSLFIVFFLGLMLGRVLTPKPQNAALAAPTPTPTEAVGPTVSPAPTIINEAPTFQFLPNKQYFDDTYVVISQDAPHQALVLSVSRIEQDKSFNEFTKVNYFDGKTWNRQTTSSITPSSSIVVNTLLRNWNPPVTSQSSTVPPLAVVQLADINLNFTSTNLQDEISVQSNPGATKFIYQGQGTMTIGTDIHQAYVFYSRTYSFNAADLSYLSQPNSVISDWLLFWDKEGTFYYLDNHKSATSNMSVTPFTIAIQENASRVVNKTNSVYIDFSRKDATTSYSLNITNPQTQEIFLPLTHTINKADTKAYSWIENVGEGNVIKSEGRSVTGVGLVDYIRQN